jgi:hypothetical protein
MKHIFLAIALLIGLQIDATAQHIKKMQPQRSHRKATHRRAHHGVNRHTYYRSHHAVTQAPAPSPYHGDNTPANDGIRKNKNRNLNYNSGQPLPPSNGGR